MAAPAPRCLPPPSSYSDDAAPLMLILDTLQSWLAAFDSRNLRERIGFFAASVAMMVFFLDILVLTPDEAKNKAIKQRSDAQKIALDAIRNEIIVLSPQLQRELDPQQQQQLAQLEEIKRTIAEADAMLAQLDNTTPLAAGGVLREALAASSGLEVVALKTLPATQVFESKSMPNAAGKQPLAGVAPALATVAPALATVAPALTKVAPAPVAKDAAVLQETAPRPARAIFQHPVEIGIKGAYLALLPYLDRLQKYPGHLHWGEVSLEVQKHPIALLKLNVYTLSGQASERVGGTSQ